MSAEHTDGNGGVAQTPKHGAKPRLFMCSSSEARVVTDAVLSHLSSCATVVPWYQGSFELGGNPGPFALGDTTIESLVKAAADCAFAIVVLTADDRVSIRYKQHWVPRDNVLFECGFFIGALGRHKTFFFTNRLRSNFHRICSE
jgi:predicted nucleotide-binding protein